MVFLLNWQKITQWYYNRAHWISHLYKVESYQRSLGARDTLYTLSKLGNYALLLELGFWVGKSVVDYITGTDIACIYIK